MPIVPLLFVWLAGPGFAPEATDPVTIVGGTNAGACQWPTTVAMLVGGDNTICSGTLIHPQVVMTAAHCLLPEAPIDAISFGEDAPDAGTPAGISNVAFCTAHPDFATMGKHDVAFCVLEVPLGLPITPLMHGCESNALAIGQEVVIAGFGSTFATVDDQGEIQTIEGVGTKRYTTQTIHSIDDTIGVVNLLGPNGSQSACFGDSGGPAYVRMADGTWRVWGTGSTTFDPGGFKPPQQPGNACGVGAAYGNAPLVVEWIESSLGFDITPCHDAAGAFTGGAGCGGFPQEIDQGGGDWNVGCFGGAIGGGAEVCEAFDGPFEPDPTDGETTGEPPDPTDGDTTGEPPDPDPPDPTGVTTIDPTPPPPTVPPAEPEPPMSESSDGTGGSSSGGADQDGDLLSRGCGCAQDNRAPLGWWIVLAWPITARTRRSRAAGNRRRDR